MPLTSEQEFIPGLYEIYSGFWSLIKMNKYSRWIIYIFCKVLQELERLQCRYSRCFSMPAVAQAPVKHYLHIISDVFHKTEGWN